jgi:choline-sulfatase
MRLCEHLHGQGLAGLESDRHEDRFDDYHDWLLAQGLADWRFGPDGGPNASRRFPYGVDAHPTGWVEREACDFLARRRRDRPLFLVVSFPHPHAPYNPPEPYASMYDPAESQLPRSGFEVNEGLPEVFLQAMTRFGQWEIPRVDPENERPLRRFLATVRGLVRHIDDAIGHVLEHLDRSDTVVLFTSDHGDYAGHRGLMRKNPWLPFDDLARIPLVVAAPDAAPGRRVPALVQSSDVVLTCLDYAGVAPPDDIDFDSRTLRPHTTSRTLPAVDDRAVFCATTMGWPMVRRGAFKYLEQRSSRTGVLFDLDHDPEERVDLLARGGVGRLADDLRAALDEEMARPPIDAPGARRPV